MNFGGHLLHKKCNFSRPTRFSREKIWIAVEIPYAEYHLVERPRCRSSRKRILKFQLQKKERNQERSSSSNPESQNGRK